MRKNIYKLLIKYLPLTLFFLFITFPIYWCLITSFKTSSEINNKITTYFPNKFTFENYISAWSNMGFNVFFKNSLIISVGGVTLIAIVSVLTGYALSRYKFKGKGLFMLILLCTQFIPGAMMITPIFLIFKELGMLNSLFSLIIINTTFRFPFNAVLMTGFVSGIDYTIEEAAQIDGCTRLQGIRKVVLPLLKPGIITVCAFSFISCWNEFLFSFMFISKEAKLTLSVGLKKMLGEYAINYGQLAAGALIAVIPTLILFCYVQKHLVGGLTSGAVKG